jgi:hypothetical protein
MTANSSAACARGRSGHARAAGLYRLSAALAAVGFVLAAVAHAAPARAETATLYEQDANDTQGKRYAGSVTWSFVKEPVTPGAKPSVAVRGDIAIPERHMTVTLEIHHNADPSLPATHLVDIVFKLPPDFSGHGIGNIAGITLKPSEQVRGTALAGLAAKVTDRYFLFGLSAIEGDAKLNFDLLRDGKWLDILVVYANGVRAVLTVEKGATGDRVFAEAFAAWQRK